MSAETITIILSVLAILVSIRANYIAGRAREESQRAMASERHQRFGDEAWELSERLDVVVADLGRAARSAFQRIVEEFDEVGPISKISGRELRHLFVELCEANQQRLEPQCGYQTASNLHGQFMRLQDMEVGAERPPALDDLLRNIPAITATTVFFECRSVLDEYWKAFDAAETTLTTIRERSLKIIERSELDSNWPLHLSPALCRKLQTLHRGTDTLLDLQLRNVRLIKQPPVSYPISYLIYVGTVLMTIQRACRWCR